MINTATVPSTNIELLQYSDIEIAPYGIYQRFITKIDLSDSNNESYVTYKISEIVQSHAGRYEWDFSTNSYTINQSNGSNIINSYKNSSLSLYQFSTIKVMRYETLSNVSWNTVNSLTYLESFNEECYPTTIMLI